MNEIADQLVQVLFKKNSLRDCSRWELEILADKYPYFGAAQLLVSGKLKEENTEDYKKQIQKTSLYFTNPLWLDYILTRKDKTEIKVETQESTAPAPAAKTEEFSAAPVETTDTVIPAQTPPVAENMDAAIAVNEQVNEAAEELTAETTVADNAEAISEITEAAPPIQTAPASENIEDTIPKPVNEQVNEAAEEAATIPVENDAAAIKIAALKTEPFDENAPLSFEPYHTVDYFASQGIKLSQEEKPKDRFGQQLKSFTQWLKALKNTAPEGIAKELNVNKGTEQKVISLAEHSLEERDVVTETMAEVWVKQGKKEKAIEVYRKLSLQNPSKSSYFAGLIEQLKQH